MVILSYFTVLFTLINQGVILKTMIAILMKVDRNNTTIHCGAEKFKRIIPNHFNGFCEFSESNHLEIVKFV